tara:strand:+ start:252 stop:455 length:204 start_codon:yes stop_codon:yes gene_type:complete
MVKERIETKKEHIDFLNEYVISNKMKMFNEVSKEFVEVTTSNVDDIAEMLYSMSLGHGISHLSFIVK